MLFFKQHFFRVALGHAGPVPGLQDRLPMRLKALMPFLLLGLLVLLFLVFLGTKFNGSRRAMALLGKQFQPSEFMKLAMIFYLSSVLSRHEERRRDSR